MSGRLMRKVLKEQEQQTQLHEEEEEEEEEEDESHSPDSSSLSSRNPFDLLLDDEHHHHNHQEFDSDIADESTLRNTDDKESSVTKAIANSVLPSDHKAKKKKKKKRKNASSDNVQKLVDVMLENLSLDASSSRVQPGALQSKPANIEVGDRMVRQFTPSILQVDPKYLSPENELRRIFGSKVVDSFEKSNQAGSSRHMRGVRRGSHSHTHNHRKSILVSPADHWPRWDGSFSMELLETKDGYHYFRYVHTSSYSQAQRAFEASKSIHDLNGIASILLHHAYHIDSLLTLAEYFKFSGEQQMSADAMAKCLYALECAWHPLFSPLQSNCLLKYDHETNKPLFTALFTHMKNMHSRGCHRSALEICKLLLSLDSDDPKGAIFCIDYFSLRAEEYAWLERFSEEYISDNSLWLFPNFSYSLAICRFYLEQEAPSSKLTPDETPKATSTDLMQQALMLHPSVLKKLVARVPLKDQVWSKILKNSFFGSDQTGNPSLDHLINIYVERSYILWRLPDIQKVLRDSSLLVIETLEHGGSDAKDWACVRKAAFSSPKNEYSHLMVLDFSDTVPTMPPENLQNFMIDPRMMREVQNAGQMPLNPLGGGGPPPRDVANRNVLAVLFESMLPWIDYGGGGAGDAENQHNYHQQDNED